MRWLTPFVACCVLLWSWPATAHEETAPASQEPAPTPPATPAEAPSGAKAPSEVVQEAPLPIYMVDENGQLKPTLNWSYKDFKELYEQAERQKQPDRPPRYTLESISAAGTVKEEYAEVTIRCRIWTRDDRWTRVPLGLEQAVVLPDPVQYQGGGECFLHLEEGGKGYVAWIRGAAEQRHELALNVWVPLTVAGEETRLRLSSPPDTSSELKLTVPVAEAVGEVSEGASLSSPSVGGGESTELAARWPGGDFELRWRKGDTRLRGTPPVLEAKGVLRAKIDKRSVITEASLTVRGDGGPFDRFRVLLPQGAELIPGNASGYSVAPVADHEAAGDEVLIEVRRDRSLPDAMEVRLTTRQTRGAAGAGGWFELGGFEVIDAVQQWGHVAVTTVGDWHVRCSPVRSVRQIEALPEEVQKELQSENVVARFEYFSQPFSLAARVLEVKTHVRVEPKYRLLVDDGQARLEADLKYTVRGAKVLALDVGLPDWELDEIGPDNVVAVEEVPQGDEAPGGSTGIVSIPLSQPSTGEIQVTLRAHQKIQPGSPALSLALPQPQADSLSPAELTVVPADNVELTPDLEHMVGLVSQRTPFSYRVEEARAVFAALLKIHAQRITVGVASEISLIEGKEAVRQTLAYEVAYEPLDKLVIEVPRSVAESGKLQISRNGQALSAVPLAGPTEPLDASSPIRMRVALPAPEPKRCDLQVHYPIEVEKLLPKSSVLCRVPLVMPGEGELSGNEVFVTAPPGIKVECQSADGPWTTSQPDPGGLQRPGGPQFSAERRAGQVDLRIYQEDHEATVVERAWVQTYLTHDARRERAVFRFTTDQKELELVLPAGVDLRRIQLLLGPENVDDRQPIRVQSTSERRLKIPLPGDSDRRPQWLEARYVFSGPRPEPGRMWIELPQLEGDVWVRRMYWELALPRNEHVIVAPEGFSAEYQWGWNGSFWGRKPLLESSQLEEWSGAEPRGELSGPSGPASRYLFSRSGDVKQCELRTAGRWLIVLGVSAAVLAGGLLLIYVPACRHPAALLAAAVAVLGGAVLCPGPALLAAEAGSLGLALALSAGLLYRTLGRGRGGGVRRETSSSVFDRSSTQPQYRPPVASQQASTETGEVEIPVPTSDLSQ